MLKNKHQYFMEHAIVTASASKCTYFQVGAVIVKDNRIISHGYNGTPEGFPEDCSDFFCGDPISRKEHHIFSEKTTIHGEMNALLWAARVGIAVDGASMYVTLQPCQNCLKSCIVAGIYEIIYKDTYDKADPYYKEFSEKANIKIISLDELLGE